MSCHTGVFPAAEGTGEPYGINRKVVEGAARAGASAGNPAPSPRQLDGVPVPALNQVVAGDPPGGEVADVFEAPGEGNGTARAPGPGAAGGPSGDPAGARLRGTGVKGSGKLRMRTTSPGRVVVSLNNPAYGALLVHDTAATGRCRPTWRPHDCLSGAAWRGAGLVPGLRPHDTCGPYFVLFFNSPA